MQRKAALHDHQHGGFQTVLMLRRHRAEDCHAGIRLHAQTIDLGRSTSGEATPGFFVRQRLARRSRCKYDGGNLRRRYVRNRRHRRSRIRQRRIEHGFQRPTLVDSIGQTIDIGIASTQTLNQIRGMVRRQQADLLLYQRRAKADSEVVAVSTQIEDMAPLRQQRGQRHHVPQELAHAYRLPLTIGQHRVITVSA